MHLIEQINRLPPEVVKYFTDPNAIDPPDMELLFPFVESALPLAYGVLGVLLFHVSEISIVEFGLMHVFTGEENNLLHVTISLWSLAS